MRDSKIKYVLIGLALAVVIYCDFVFIKAAVNGKTRIETSRCGDVLRRYDAFETRDRGSQTEHNYYLDVRYESGVESEKVSVSTWYNYEAGGRVCFIVPDPAFRAYNNWINICGFVLLMSGFVTAILFLIWLAER